MTTDLGPPNILLITCHDLGRHLGCYGFSTVRTPNLDRLAATGVRLERAFAVSSGCSPSRASLATGRYPHSNGVMGLSHPPFNWDLHPDEKHVAEILGDAGYDTHLFGFQHVSPNDERAGFEHVHTDHDSGLARVVAGRVCSLLREPRDSRPFYLEVNLEEPHRPYDQGGCRPDDSLGVTVPDFLPAGPESIAEMAALQGAIHQADEGIGRILAALDEAGLRENTFVLFLTDHGIAMPRAKCTLYDAGLEIAAILRWPRGGIGGGQVVEDLVSNIDVLPAVLDAIGVPVPERVQGRSFMLRLRGEPFTARTEIFAEKTYHSYYDPMRAIRTERYKYIRNFEPAFRVEMPGDVADGLIFRAHIREYFGGQHPAEELYDLQADRWEQTNLADVPEHAEMKASLAIRLAEWMRETGDPLLTGPVASPGLH